MTETISYEVLGNCGIIHLARLPQVVRSLRLLDQVAATLRRAVEDPTGCVLVVCGGCLETASEPGTAERAVGPEPCVGPAIQALADSAKPSLAVLSGEVRGLCLEVALGCHERWAEPTATLGFVELRLGCLPSAGGTQRAPQLMGLELAVGLFEEPYLTAEAAQRARLVNRVVSGGQQLHLATEALARGTAGKAAVGPQVTLPTAAAMRVLRSRWAKRYRGQEAPQRLLDCIEVACRKSFSEGLGIERQAAAACRESAQAQALEHLYRAEAGAGVSTAISVVGTPPPVRSVAVMGGGTMGRGIAINCLSAGLQVMLVEVSEESRQKVRAGMEEHFADEVKRGRLSDTEKQAQRTALRTSTDWADVRDVDAVIEAVFEDLPLKQQVFRRLDEVCQPGTLLATNTSYLNINDIAAVTTRAGDVLGLHFFSPAHVMRLLEVIRGAATSATTLQRALQLGRRLRKIAVIAGVCDGFIGNRMLRQYNAQGQLCLLEGATPEQIDGALEGFGMAMGPFAVADLAGLDISYRARQRLPLAVRGDPRTFAVADALVELGRLGRKTQAGYYTYGTQSRERKSDPRVLEIIEAQSARLGVVRQPLRDREIVDRLMFALINEGARLLGEGIAANAADIDLVYCHGYGFPAFRGGPMFYAESLGLATVYRRLNEYHSRYGTDQWTPAPLLKELVSAPHPNAMRWPGAHSAAGGLGASHSVAESQ